ncbi:uncharacterized protein LOC121394747 isoform X2 [Xenopus laevis]|uniref:Uncharacterized protein LOC121394747 isoform X2 n=1 Tax=Xenopus laevis TaxID=8355 RepID=A0A8J1L1K2_XENLA|nr:uncharacterized protein LOC121394747 isoform X2 [Xenopus laevis]
MLILDVFWASMFYLFFLSLSALSTKELFKEQLLCKSSAAEVWLQPCALTTQGAVKEQLLCKSSVAEVWLQLCDGQKDLKITMEACDFNRLPYVTVEWIPRMDLYQLYGEFVVWYQFSKYSEFSKEFCSGTDDAFSTCGTLKGETTTFNITGYDPIPYLYKIKKSSLEENPLSAKDPIITEVKLLTLNGLVLCFNITIII